MSDAAALFRPVVPPRNAGPIGLIEFLWKSWRDPLTTFNERHFTLPFTFGESRFGAVINVSNPAGVRHVLLDNAKNYEKGELQRRVFGPMISDGVFMNEGDDWRRARRILAPLFTPARVGKTAQQMLEVCQRRVAPWPDGAILDIDPEMTGITFEIISQTMFSNMLGGESARFEAAFNSFVDTTGRISPLDILGAPSWIPRLGKLSGMRTSIFFERRVAQLVTERRAMLGRGETPDDLLTALLQARDSEGGAGLSEHEVAANVLTFIIAGHETTARALGWALHLLSRAPDVQARVQAEADVFDLADPQWAQAMPWSRAVFDEAMRLFPPAPTTLRVALAPDVICGQAIPAGTLVVIAPYIIHRHKALWEDPEAFKPERFLPGAREGIDRFAYIPFSGGPRICIGAAFAIQEAMIALATIMRTMSVEPAEAAEPMPSHRITLRAKHGIRLRVRKR